jgi:hypothetical protein
MIMSFLLHELAFALVQLLLGRHQENEVQEAGLKQA